MKRECVAKQYTIEVDLLKIMDSDSFHENENEWDEILDQKLDKIKGVEDVDYNGHFGSYVFLTIETEFDTPELWLEIEKTIKESY